MDNASTGVCVIAHEIGKRNSRHGYSVDNKSGDTRSRHNKPTYGIITGSAVKLKTVYVGKNQYPISIVQLDEVSDIAWRKKSGFKFLTYPVGSLSGSHNVSDLITLVDNKLPMDTYSTLKYTEKQTSNVMDSTFGFDNISASVFIIASGKVLNYLQKARSIGQKGSSSSHLITVSTQFFCIKQDPF